MNACTDLTSASSSASLNLFVLEVRQPLAKGAALFDELGRQLDRLPRPRQRLACRGQPLLGQAARM
jgi:hypothetical protein